MHVTLRPGTAADAVPCGTICYEAFTTISEAHRFPPDFPSAEIAIGLITWMLAHPRVYSVVAEADGRVVGSNFLDERNVIAGVGPITVDPQVQNSTIGRRLMENVDARATQQNFPGRAAGAGRLSHPLPLALHKARVRRA
jgi:GNAT superfamily N-acetyltransferase